MHAYQDFMVMLLPKASLSLVRDCENSESSAYDRQDCFGVLMKGCGTGVWTIRAIPSQRTDLFFSQWFHHLPGMGLAACGRKYLGSFTPVRG